MGAYLSEPVTKKDIETDEDSNFWVSSASMQGWRVSQEDAHNAILNFDDFSSLFAVYDGHGGHEVAVYTAKRLPNFIKSRKDYRMGRIEDGLVEAFVEFDRSLIERDIVRELRVIAGKEAAGEEEQVDAEEVDSMLKEATMPIEDVIKSEKQTEDQNSVGASSAKSSTEVVVTPPESAESSNPMSAVTRFKTRNGGSGKPISPFLRAKPSNGSDKEQLTQEKLSFEKTSEDHTKVINNGSIEEEKSNGHDNKDETAKEEQNGNGHDASSNGDATEKSEDKKGKGKGKGKGKSSQIIKDKSSNESSEELDEEIPSPVKEAKKAKSAQELYHNLVSDDVMEEESEEEDDEDTAFAAESSDDDDDDDGHDMSGDDTEELESSEEEDTPDEDEDDGEEYIGGDFNEEPGNDSGCTAVVGLLVGRDLYVANAGDSRCIVCRDGKAIEMSFDHKPEDELERNRINKAGGKVTQDGRVNGGLNLSRAIGDHAYKTNKSLPLQQQMISPVPDVKKLTLQPETDSFIFLACDGIWNSLSSQEVVDFINDKMEKTKDSKLEERQKLTKILEELFEHCLAPDTMGDGTGCDNMTAVIAKLKTGAFDTKSAIVTTATTKSEVTTTSEAVKRPNEDSTESSSQPCPVAKKAKTENNESTETSTQAVKDEEKK